MERKSGEREGEPSAIGISFRKLHWEVDVAGFNLHLPTLSDIWPAEEEVEEKDCDCDWN